MLKIKQQLESLGPHILGILTCTLADGEANTGSSTSWLDSRRSVEDIPAVRPSQGQRYCKN